jgi:predicted CXXCH cytochrome family protein
MRTCIHIGIRVAVVVVALFMYGLSGAMAQDSSTLPVDDQCITCHLDLEAMPDDFTNFDIHLSDGLSCTGCHGGDSTVDDEELAKAPGTGFIGIPERSDIPALCAQCHSDPAFMKTYRPRMYTDQLDQYNTSVHGEKNREGDQNVAVCSSCHSAHSILPASDPRSTVYALNVPDMCSTCHADAEYMKTYAIRTNQYEEYAEGVHGKALLEREDIGAPACNDCHGNHGAVPPDVASLEDVCGSCHPANQQYFDESKMAKPFAEDDLHSCIECHNNHAINKPFDDFVGVSDSAICMDCHDEGEDGYKMATAINRNLIALVSETDSALTMLDEVIRVGMNDIEIDYLLKEAHHNLVQARTLVHTFDSTRVALKVSEGVEKVHEAMKDARSEIVESKTRRIGLGISSVFITILIIGLYFKSRDADADLKNKRS